MTAQLERLVDSALENTVAQPQGNLSGGMPFIVQWLAKAGPYMYPWWSTARDVQLRNFWKNSDHLSGAVYTFGSKMASIPVKVVPRDPTVKEHVKQAELETIKLLMAADFGAGWAASFMPKAMEDWVGQDNGFFAEIIGSGPADGPIIGAPVTVRHLDSRLCQRTGDSIYPVLYRDPHKGMFKLHFTRVIYSAQMPSPIAEMFSVGFCAISRAIWTAQNLIDILTYKAEKLGSRPTRAIIVTKGGLDPQDVQRAFQVINSDLDSAGLNRYSKVAVVGNSSLPNADLDVKDLAGLPDNFDERTSLELGMATIALAFGMDARELFPALTSGATRADALIQHLKQRGKGPGMTIQMLETQFNAKYLPPHLMLKFDFQDDEEDRQAAETKEIRCRRWVTAIKTEIMDARTCREQMVEVGDLERGQFEQLELADGRLPDGTSVLALFYSEDKEIKKLLRLGVDVDPFDVEANDEKTILDAIRTQTGKVNTVLVNSNNPTERWKAQQALAALKELEKKYRPEPLPVPPNAAPASSQPGEPKTEQEHDPRLRTVSAGRAAPPRIESDELEPERDEERIKEAGATEDPFDVDMALKTIAGYRLNLRSLFRALWSGEFVYDDFYMGMIRAIDVAFTQAWREGAKAFGIVPSEYTDEERIRLRQEIFHETQFIDGVAMYIEQNSKANGGKIGPLLTRAEQWVHGYTRVMNVARAIAAKDRKGVWTMHAAKEHCRSCQKLNGKVKRFSYWRQHVLPKDWDMLECRGGCKCTIEPTNEPLSRGPLPKLP